MSSEILLDHARRILRRKHYAYRTEQRYLAWIKRFILFHGKRHPTHMGQAEIEAFLTHLAVNEKVAAATTSAPVRFKKLYGERSNSPASRSV